MKLESIINELFFYQNMYFLHANLSTTAAAVAAAEKFREKRRNFVN
jgi:hypothetical protein